MKEKENDIFTIHLQLGGGFRFPLKNIPRKDEEMYRNAEKMVNQYLDKYSKLYQHRSIEEVYLIVAFQLAVRNVKGELIHDTDPIIEKISELTMELDKVLSED